MKRIWSSEPGGMRHCPKCHARTKHAVAREVEGSTEFVILNCDGCGSDTERRAA
jgi:hypothetical protein